MAAGLNLRTIQRIEKDGQASLQSAKALAAALDLDVQDLGAKEDAMKSCPECGSNEVYRYVGEVDMQTLNGNLLPGLRPGSILTNPRACPTVCADCGYLRFFVAPASLAKLKRAAKWRPEE